MYFLQSVTYALCFYDHLFVIKVEQGRNPARPKKIVFKIMRIQVYNSLVCVVCLVSYEIFYHRKTSRDNICNL